MTKTTKKCGLAPLREESREKDIAAIPNEAVRQQCERLASACVTLPSKYHSVVRNHSALEEARRIELALREGEASAALDYLRCVLTAGTSINHAIGRAAGHKLKADLRGLQKDEMQKAKKAASEYSRIRNLMLALGMDKDHDEYREVTDEDIRPFAVTHYERRRGDRKRTPSWIWKNSAYINALPDGDMKEYVEESECSERWSGMLTLNEPTTENRVLWFRRACVVARWQEEVLLRLEEMYRSLMMFEHQRTYWMDRADEEDCVGDESCGAYYRR